MSHPKGGGFGGTVLISHFYQQKWLHDRSQKKWEDQAS